MTHMLAIPASSALVLEVVNWAARTLVLAAATAIGLAAFRVKATSVRLFSWSAVLYAALAMPFLGSVLPPLSVPTPAFLQVVSRQGQLSGDESSSQPRAAVAIRATALDKNTVPGQDATGREKRVASTQTIEVEYSPSSRNHAIAAAPAAATINSSALLRPVWRSIPWKAVVTGVYFAIALLLLVRFMVGLVYSHRLVRVSQPIHEPRVIRLLAFHARVSGIVLTPRVCESALVSVPVTVGALRSTILLPNTWNEWEAGKLDAVIGHELSHVARRDALTQRLSLLHRAIFWFSPLAWWLDRHLANLAEQASDEAALSRGADRNDYARTLLGFFEALQAAPGRVWWQGVSMAKAGQAEQRLERILAWRGAVTMSLKKSVVIAIIAFAVPVVYLAASARPVGHSPTQQAAPDPPSAVSTNPASAVPAVPAAPAAPASTVIGVIMASGGHTVIRPITPVAPYAPKAPMAPRSGISGGVSSGNSYAHGYDDDDDLRFVIASGKSDSMTMSGSRGDVKHVEKLKKQIEGDFIWFQRDEKSYIIRDQATIDRAKKLWAPQEELGKQQEALGKQQEALGKQQSELGEKMEQVRVKVPDLTAELDKLKAELKEMGGAGATMEQVGKIQSEIGELQSKIGEIQSHAGDQQSKLGEEMGALGEKQGKLGEQQGELGRKQGELAEEASRQMKQLLDEAITKGTAQPEPDSGPSASL